MFTVFCQQCQLSTEESHPSYTVQYAWGVESHTYILTVHDIDITFLSKWERRGSGGGRVGGGGGGERGGGVGEWGRGRSWSLPPLSLREYTLVQG